MNQHYIKTQQDAIDRLRAKKPTPIMSQEDIDEAIEYHQANIEAEMNPVDPDEDFYQELRNIVAV